MKKNLVLAVLVVVMIAALAVSCTGGVKIEQFDAPESITAEYKENCEVPAVTVKTSDGKETAAIYHVFAKSDGREISVESGKFLADEKTGYTIVYSASEEEDAETRETKVNVVDTTDPELQFSNPNVSELMIRGGTMRLRSSDVIATDNSGEDPDISFSVAYNDSTKVDVDAEGNFSADKDGKYTVTYTATDADGNDASISRDFYTTINFGTENQLAMFKAHGNIQFSTNTDKKFTLFGETSGKAVLPETTGSWPLLYWENLGNITDSSAVSFYIYNDGTQDERIWLNDREGVNDITLGAKTWTYIEIPKEQYSRVFIVQPPKENNPASYGGTGNATISVHFDEATAQSDLYFAELTVHKDPPRKFTLSAVETDAPALNQPFTLPQITVKDETGAVVSDAQVTYAAYNDAFKELAITDNAFTPETEISYLSVCAQSGERIGFIRLKLVAVSRDPNEIDYFESASCLDSYTASYKSKLTHETTITASSESKGALGFDPFVQYSIITIGEGVGNADLTGVTKIEFDLYIVDELEGIMDQSKGGFIENSYVDIQLDISGVVLTARVTESNKWVKVSLKANSELPELTGAKLFFMAYKGGVFADKNDESGVTEGPTKLPADFMYIIDNLAVVR